VPFAIIRPRRTHLQACLPRSRRGHRAYLLARLRSGRAPGDSVPRGCAKAIMVARGVTVEKVVALIRKRMRNERSVSRAGTAERTRIPGPAPYLRGNVSAAFQLRRALPPIACRPASVRLRLDSRDQTRLVPPEMARRDPIGIRLLDALWAVRVGCRRGRDLRARAARCYGRTARTQA
jgi:hypothetical protein